MSAPLSADDIRRKIVAALPDAVVVLEDLTGTSDHWKAQIVSSSFSGKSTLARHRLINSVLAEDLKGPIHALSMDLRAPDE